LAVYGSSCGAAALCAIAKEEKLARAPQRKLRRRLPVLRGEQTGMDTGVKLLGSGNMKGMDGPPSIMARVIPLH
jgi:hypothetical protein